MHHLSAAYRSMPKRVHLLIRLVLIAPCRLSLISLATKTLPSSLMGAGAFLGLYFSRSAAAAALQVSHRHFRYRYILIPCSVMVLLILVIVGFFLCCWVGADALCCDLVAAFASFNHWSFNHSSSCSMPLGVMLRISQPFTIFAKSRSDVLRLISPA